MISIPVWKLFIKDIKMIPLNPKKILYAILSGVLLTASFPPGRLEWTAWFALVPLLVSIANESPRNAFKLGMISGVAHYLTLMYWIIVVLHSYGGLNYLLSSGALLLLSLYLSLYLGLFSFLFIYFGDSRFQLLLSASIWVGLEYIRAKFITGLPWCLLGYSQFSHLTLIQIADLVGVYGLSFLAAAVNTLIYIFFFNQRRPFQKRILRWDVAIILVMIVATMSYGHLRLQAYYAPKKTEPGIRTAIVQGNIDQSLKWDPAFQIQTIKRYHKLTQATYPYHPNLIVWPETAVPLYFQNRSLLSAKVSQIPRESGALLIFGSPAYERKDNITRYYNRVYLLSPKATISGFYDKMHLVPFGEYVPLKKFFPFINRLVQAAGDFASGKKATPLSLHGISAGVLICFEGIFPELSRSQAKNGANILINVTNDAWYGMTSAPHQHLCMSLFRAVENRRWLIRSANTGFSAFIDPCGKIIKKGSLFMEEVLIQEVEPESSLTVYAQYGDLFVLILFMICLIHFFYRLYYH
jgi:apolipoprotein N-acyltransferase